MSSNPNKRAVRLVRPRTWPLRIRLVAALAALGVALCVAVGIGTLLALRAYLIKQVDTQLAEAQARSMDYFEMGRLPFVRFNGPGPMFLDGPGQSAGTLGAIKLNDAITEAAVMTASGDRQGLNPVAVSSLSRVPTDHTSSVPVDGLGDYRIAAQRIDGKDGWVITGLPLASADATLTSATRIIGGFSLVALLCTVGAGMVIIRRELDPLSRMSLAAQRVAGLPLHQGEVDLPTPIEPVDCATAHTEVGRLGTALNMMVERVADGLSVRHSSEMRVRQFVADASHELRTPLASVLGYTQFAQHLVDSSETVFDRRSHDDLVHALRRVRAESQRMSALVEDMLLLARLDEGRPLECDDLDVLELVIDTVSDAKIASPDHRWSVRLPDDSVHIVGDRIRLHHALANLLSNARTHTPAGTKIVASVTQHDDGSVEIAVRDDGPGIPDGLVTKVFDRFARGDGSRSRAAGNTGLGLAIARAVINAHDGSIDVRSGPQGTTFTVHLPAAASPVGFDDVIGAGSPT